MKALIESVQKKVSKSGKTYFAVKAGGKSYATFDDKIMGLTGKTVNFDEEAQEVGDKTYWNMRNIRVLADEPDTRQATMLLSYAKDIVVAMIAKGTIEGMADALTYTNEAYHAMQAIIRPKEEEEENDYNIPF